MNLTVAGQWHSRTEVADSWFILSKTQTKASCLRSTAMMNTFMRREAFLFLNNHDKKQTSWLKNDRIIDLHQTSKTN